LKSGKWTGKHQMDSAEEAPRGFGRSWEKRFNRRGSEEDNRRARHFWSAWHIVFWI